MSTVRLEIIRDKATRSVHMCRDLPEDLVGLVGDEAFSTFCDRLDSWLEILDKEHIRELKQFMCILVTLGLVCFFTTSFAIACSRGLWMSSVLWVSPIPFLLVWCYNCYRRPYGALSIDEIMYKIRAECADMTHHAPNLYFLVGSESRVYVDHIDVSFTLLARWEIIKDKATLPVRSMPAHMCRDLPAALEGIVADETFHTFCDRLDSWLELLGAADNREAKQARCVLLGISLCSILFVVPFFFITDNTSFFGLWMGSLLCIPYIIFLLVSRFTRLPYGALSSDEIMNKIRAECDNMTHHAPSLSFKVVMWKPPSDGYGESNECIDYIGVSASLSTQESDVASVPVVLVRGDNTTIKIDEDENESDTDTEADTMSSTSSGDAAMEHV
jgi:hypothetical protein